MADTKAGPTLEHLLVLIERSIKDVVRELRRMRRRDRELHDDEEEY